jgi:hypothetical protein
MPLTRGERDFLDAYVYEATHGPPFGGPATKDLGQRGIWYTDLSWILTAYSRELSAAGEIPFGIHNPTPPPSPWENLEQARHRNEALKHELEAQEMASSNRQPHPSKDVPVPQTTVTKNDGE